MLDPHPNAMTMTMTSEADIHVPPLQFKGEIMDFDLGIEVDHRKRCVILLYCDHIRAHVIL